MDPRSGQVFGIGVDAAAELGEKLALEQLQAAMDRRGAQHDELAAVKHLAEGGELVAVSRQVARAQQVGQRELERRKTARKAAKRARKRNRK